jgi:outer membrane lipoprotein carrier protein
VRSSFIWSLLVLTITAPSVSLPASIHALESHYKHARTLKAIFFERYSDGNGGVTAESGTVYFSQPGRMRWEYESPENKLFIVDGKNAWFYVPADHSASRAKMKESSDWRTPLALLAGNADLAKLCRTIDIPDSDEKIFQPGDTLLRCIPRNNPVGPRGNLPYVLFEIDPHAELTRVVIRDAGNAETEFRFGNWEENIIIPEVKFHFQPPPGVSVVDQSSLVDTLH